jgi:hypothetical protein
MMRMLFLVLLVLVFTGTLYWIWYMPSKESFATNDASSDDLLETKIIDIYMEVLNRQPSGTELVDYQRQINNGEMTLMGLRQKLIDSEEYERLIKTQTNVLAPELNKMLSDKLLIEKIAKIYKEEKGKTIPNELIFPYKDVYIYLEYNEFAFRAFLRDKKYGEFENDILRMEKPTKEKVIALLDKKMSKKSLMSEGAKLKKENDAKLASLKKKSEENDVDGSSPSKKINRSIYDKDSDSTKMLKSIDTSCKNIFDKDLEAQCLDKNKRNILLTHKGDMVLRPEYEWSVPHQRTPVCTTLGQPVLTQPVFVNSSLLLGTPLEDAKNTEVGSIMPKFTYQDYISVSEESLKCQ